MLQLQENMTKLAVLGGFTTQNNFTYGVCEFSEVSKECLS